MVQSKVKALFASSKRRARPLLRMTARFVGNSSIPTVLLITSLLFARYLPNSDFSYPTEIVLPIVMFAVLATAVFYIFKLSFRGKSGPAHVASFLLIYALYGFNYAFPYVQKWADAVLPSSLTTSFSSAALRVLLLGVLFWLAGYGFDRLIRHVKPLRQLQPYKILLFVICFVFGIQAIKVSDRLWEIRHQWSYHPQTALPDKPLLANASSQSQAATPTPTTDTNTQPNSPTGIPTAEMARKPTKPNVYYLLFDRYASADTLQRVYNFDNSPMLNFLGEQGFVTRDKAYSNYPFTQQSVSSTLSMGYLGDLEHRFKNDANGFQTAFPYRSIISDPPVAQVFRQNGYQYNQLSSWWDFTRVGVTADDDPVKSFRLRILGMTFWLTDLQRDIVYKSAFSPLLQKGLSFGSVTVIKYDQDRNPRQNFMDQLSALATLAKNGSNEQKPQFTFAHILSPHDPYLFAPDGSQASYNGDRTDQDVDEYVKYVNQLKYANTRITTLISTIRQQDPNAVIIFQADEGPYPKQFRGSLSAEHYYDPKDLPDDTMRHKFGIMASYYMPGIDSATVSSQLNSSVNVFPFVLNNYLGYDIKYLPECNFSAGNKYTVYDYSLMTGRLQSGTNPAACAQYDR
jgi:hypothetical protein